MEGHPAAMSVGSSSSAPPPAPLPSSSPGTAEITADVDRIVDNYFTTLSAKDDDIFRLYADNTRMRELVETTLRGRAELEAQLRATTLLAETLKTELNEKRHLIDAQEAESRVLRDGVASLRVILGRPSELHATVDDIVADVEALRQERRWLSAAVADMESGVNGVCEWAADALVEGERRGRRAIADAAAADAPFAHALGDLLAHAAETEGRLVAELQRTRHAASEELAAAAEQRALAAAHADADVGRATRALEEEQRWGRSLAAALAASELQRREEARRREIVADAHERAVEIFVEHRGWSTGTWRRLVGERNALAAQLDGALADAADAHAELRDVKAALVQETEALAKSQGQLRRLDGLRPENAALTERLQRRDSELEELKAKHLTLSHKLITQRQQSAAAAKALAETVQQLQSTAEDLQRRNSGLDHRINGLQEENRLQAKRLRQAQRRTEELEEEQATAADAHAKRLVELAAVNEAAVTAAVAAAEERCGQRHAEELRSQAEAHAKETAALAEEHAAAAAAHEAVVAKATEEERGRAQRETDGMRRELQEWVLLVDQLRDQLREAQTQLQAERDTRALLEQHKQSESALLERVMAASTHSTAAGAEAGAAFPSTVFRDPLPPSSRSSSLHRGPASTQEGDMAAGQTRYHINPSDRNTTTIEAALRRRVGLLEQSCRRSAAVITELREELHRRSQHATTTPTSSRTTTTTNSSSSAVSIAVAW